MVIPMILIGLLLIMFGILICIEMKKIGIPMFLIGLFLFSWAMIVEFWPRKTTKVTYIFPCENIPIIDNAQVISYKDNKFDGGKNTVNINKELGKLVLPHQILKIDVYGRSPILGVEKLNWVEINIIEKQKK